MIFIPWKMAICIAVLAIGLSPAFSETRIVKIRVDSDTFRRIYESNELKLFNRQEKLFNYRLNPNSLNREGSDILAPREIEQSPIDLCSINPDLPRCRIFR